MDEGNGAGVADEAESEPEGAARPGTSGTQRIVRPEIEAPEAEAAPAAKGGQADADPRFLPGRVFHQVEIVRFIDSGYSGRVFEVRHRVSGERCALKVMHMRDRGNARKQERSRAEADGTFGISHANVVEVIDAGIEADGIIWILMEYLDGITLEELLRRQGRLSPPFALWVATEVAWALDAAHENQIIHRDVKPGNVMLTRDGRVVLLDFSIAKNVPYDARTTEPTVRLGTAGYMSPENLLGADADARFDIYALGITLWELMTGDHPFKDSFGNQRRLIMRHITDPLPPLSEVIGLPAYVDELIQRATAKDPNQRFMTAAELAGAQMAVGRRLEEDRAAGRCTWTVPAGEPSVPGRAAVYVPPVAGLPAEAPGRAPSAKVLVAPKGRGEAGPEEGRVGGTMPVDVEAVRAATQAAWYAPRGGWERQAAESERATAPLPRQARSGDGSGIGHRRGDGPGNGHGNGIGPGPGNGPGIGPGRGGGGADAFGSHDSTLEDTQPSMRRLPPAVPPAGRTVRDPARKLPWGSIALVLSAMVVGAVVARLATPTAPAPVVGAPASSAAPAPPAQGAATGIPVVTASAAAPPSSAASSASAPAHRAPPPAPPRGSGSRRSRSRLFDDSLIEEKPRF